ncbi:hypothetical protein BFV94_4762 [Alteromonas macleodii]|uniref:Uncharacterized protein n=1 Tax=Alteromonas macleodii TaxID=28108 RepID=A0AB36FQQ0_ALTMA|nr:hypothetical protein BFV95_4991 [Alteromonas macleodii]OES24611.1 hypothetical protein BFV94_4762 [Alteromonas macleodii]OES39030.1 hypothetical protein BFV96_4431 [Alteromonas macleodii]
MVDGAGKLLVILYSLACQKASLVNRPAGLNKKCLSLYW